MKINFFKLKFVYFLTTKNYFLTKAKGTVNIKLKVKEFKNDPNDPNFGDRKLIETEGREKKKENFLISFKLLIQL